MAPFIEELKKALDCYLDPYFDETVYIDQERLKPGYRFNEALAKALCESLCMVVVYVPKYEKHGYCLREFAAMEYLEDKRRKAMGSSTNPERGMIIPVILRGDWATLPDKIKSKRHCADFSKYTTVTPKFLTNHEYVDKIQQIVQAICELHQDIASTGVDVWTGCDEFRLPDNPTGWRAPAKIPEAPLPSRESAP